MAGDSSLCQGELDETITYAGTNNASAQAILLTFIQVGALTVVDAGDRRHGPVEKDT
jgi:hypothetical protein